VETGATVQLVAEKDPVEAETKVRLPVGVTFAPTEESVTVAVQLEAWLTTTGLVQTTPVEVVRGFTVMLAPALMLAS
jgi:hypothetical protein